MKLVMICTILVALVSCSTNVICTVVMSRIDHSISVLRMGYTEDYQHHMALEERLGITLGQIERDIIRIRQKTGRSK